MLLLPIKEGSHCPHPFYQRGIKIKLYGVPYNSLFTLTEGATYCFIPSQVSFSTKVENTSRLFLILFFFLFPLMHVAAYLAFKVMCGHFSLNQQFMSIYIALPKSFLDSLVTCNNC